MQCTLPSSISLYTCISADTCRPSYKHMRHDQLHTFYYSLRMISVIIYVIYNYKVML